MGITRRTFLKGAAVFAGGGYAFYRFALRFLTEPGEKTFSPDILGRGGGEHLGESAGGGTPYEKVPAGGEIENFSDLMEITPTGEFYLTHYRNAPQIDAGRWSLRIEGEVDEEIELGYEDLLALPSVELVNTLVCIGNPVGGYLIGNAHWRGVRFRDLLIRAGVRGGAVDAVLHGAEGYEDSFPLEKALHPDTILAYEMNGEPLTPPHGFPLRAIVPGLYGIKNVKWLTRIEVVGHDYRGFWQRRGWSETGSIKLMSRIDMPREGDTLERRETMIAGIAFGGLKGVSRVEVSADDGKTWEEATVKEPLSPYAWSLWKYRWAPPEPGEYTLVVRAYDREGRVQPSSILFQNAFPSGAEGYHRVPVTVR
jgi:DMSO/TMAO reductase YedYZ molybdopterin-dependent catalytic subunit